MKKITLMAALFAGFAMTAQTTFFSDDFNDEDVSDWTLYDEDGDGNSWADIFEVTDTDGNPVTPVSLISRSWQSFPLTPDNWIVSPAIDLTTANGDVQLTWKVQAAAAEWDNENYSVYVATSSDLADLESATVTFTEVYDDPNDEGTQYERSLDLSSLAGETVYLAFRHHDVTDKDFLSIDDVMVTGVLAVGTNEFKGFKYSVANNQLSLSANTSIEKVAIYNMLGQQVVSQKLSSDNETVNLSGLQSGVYIATVSINGASKSFKIVKN
ncbi:Cleaved Adhesin Domain protein [Aequorivita sublithincola DSM 14238]|uniref:Cleaved Adhesin Domain protein n=1 Tax=Aequorivita sublithincola (strain DSM 14238 / LMG 21431 / ACAM 643 / 9-3) TaxID=746697 RepID=I3YWG7_AEQSU|nr:choice-of-anchor J domain-containing protein [Aequorivita sublithincola]AFL81335.1 Cleaved Adhesin Domain protein [Aequorivita sublithincola DSM 14238]